MSSGGKKRTRSERVAALELAPTHWKRVMGSLRRQDVLARIALAAAASLALCVVVRGWAPPFTYRVGYAPSRDLIARVAFSDPVATQRQRDLIAGQVRYVYCHDPEPLARIRSELADLLPALLADESLPDEPLAVWQEFLGPDERKASAESMRRSLRRFHEALEGSRGADALLRHVAETLAPYERRGFSVRLLQKPGEGHQGEIAIYSAGRPEQRETVKVREIILRDRRTLEESLVDKGQSEPVAEAVSHWLWSRLAKLGTTLTRDEAAIELTSQEAAEAAADSEVVRIEPGRPLADASQLLSEEDVRVLRLEHEAFVAEISPQWMAGRAAAVTLLIFATLCVCGVYLHFRERSLMLDLRRLATLVGMVVVTVVLMRWLAGSSLHAELVPLLLFGQTVAIAYRQELALLLCGTASLVLVLGMGHALAQFLVLMGAAATAIAQMGRVRSRSKLIYVGLSAGAVAAALSAVAGVLDNQPLSRSLLWSAATVGVWGVAAGFLMSGLLPFVEKAFGVLTDISLLELGDVAHPLLQELIRRAPSTYNHSVTVGSIAEAAAESIGARGLLVRVGAYFHDIGKMLKPGYFIENQSPDCNQHATLLPAMSTLVIIAHVKDGADLARQHHLPEPIIDFIRQHHGTTLVEYFFALASEQSQSDPNGSEIEESNYRYPGPRPQTREACVLMLADAVEGASRTLVDPTPARIESLVRQVTERRLEDGQFDESNLTLRELRTVQNSLVKSLIAIYHGRVKYPEQKTA